MRHQFTRGYSGTREKVSKKSKYTMSCFNCEYCYKLREDAEELCQNPEVLKYDMIVEGDVVYCNQWSMVRRDVDVRTLFKKGGRVFGEAGNDKVRK